MEIMGPLVTLVLCIMLIIGIALIFIAPIVLIIVLIIKSTSNSKSVPRNYEEWRYNNRGQ
jgi:predicted RND superfamily exporter protein